MNNRASTNAKRCIVGITGAKGTGKSTLASELSTSARLRAHFGDVCLVESPGKLAAALSKKLGADGDDDTHMYFAARHLENLRTAKGRKGLVVLDRCFVDHYAYVLTLSQNSDLVDLMRETMWIYAREVRLVIVTALVPPFSERKFATEPLQFRRSIDGAIDVTLKEFDISSKRLQFPPNYIPDAEQAILSKVARRA